MANLTVILNGNEIFNGEYDECWGNCSASGELNVHAKFPPIERDYSLPTGTAI